MFYFRVSCEAAVKALPGTTVNSEFNWSRSTSKLFQWIFAFINSDAANIFVHMREPCYSSLNHPQFNMCSDRVFLELMESEGPPESESSEKSVFFSQQEEKEEDDNEEEESKEAEETATINPLLPPALTGDVEGLQKIFEDSENPHHEQAMQLLLEEDIAGRNLLYAACMAGQSDVIRALAKYGVNLNEKTTRGYTLLHCAAAWGRLETLKALVELDVDIESLNFQEERARDVAARYSQTECVEFLDRADARLALKKYIAKVSAIVTDTAKGPGKLFKEDKNTILNACRIKNEWLETHLEASINELFEQKQQLEDIVTPIFTKMATPHAVCFFFFSDCCG
ncbi:sodium/hydrogen exchanger 11 isoform X4 [Kogia breviceps]|uniref:sodium/hydrogen exchanger 11 isoform X4 n=2 Tax=Kogia breviceps TaxID=27615 RepID=UPI0034D3284C